jgi:hypothetical protein
LYCNNESFPLLPYLSTRQILFAAQYIIKQNS